ncbi:bifunctional 5,10-methylenetetrahydrofolate dehydrogenase/5,10-methenyltetrahydrofolate cyclohydrolase [Candidatus Peregrinibacteria bacterium]|jgi:methylenetetrahydrofolate dehydrogenase (NADP+) / methenyltetrahydrofolate cyclohydrolase|nr:bifunctional 5,10-methylenetetrahydrofolate dehydrogenase/5,10-methenyltetrahydrofolate cyclohydrolase [Candidatus Peregrinibacteria bacterium]
MQILNGKETSEKILSLLKCEIDSMQGVKPCLSVILIGNNPASAVYVKNKAKACEKIGVEYKEYAFDNDVNEEEIYNRIEEINNDPQIHGLIVQLPVPKHISVPKILKHIDPKKDVDGFTAYNIGKMIASKDFEDLPPATPAGIIRLLDEYDINVAGMNAVVIGRSNIVGKPIANMLTNRSATVSVCHSQTKDISYYTKNADLIIAAVGIPKFLKSHMVKDGVIIVDVGINRLEDGSLCGDIDFENIKDRCDYVTPVPGGVGPMTIAQLMVNVVKSVY